jgi:glycosyltransferase involved in cell wall biosynthesis
MRDTTDFSIATPTRNALEQLKRCVGSVRGQKGVSHEHLVQDAMSSDGTSQWLLAQSDIAAVSETDSGMYDAINRSWNRSSGKILSWLNSDEQYLPGTLERVAKQFESNPSVDVIWGNVIVVDGEGAPVALRREIPFRRIYVVNNFLYVLSCAAFFRRSLFDKGLLKFDTKYRFSGDMDLMLRLARSGAVIRHFPRYLSIFGNDGGNLSNNSRGVANELRSVRESHGAFRNPKIRKLVMLGRHLERLAIGAYLPRSIKYRYAVDAKPSYIEVSAEKIGGRFTVSDIQGRPATIRTVDSD